MGRKPPHVLDAEERKKAVELKGLHVDIGVKDGDEARSLVRAGDQVVIAAEPLELPNGRLASRALDNRLGRVRGDRGGAASEGGRRRRWARSRGVAAVQEEIGSHGARAMAYGLEPDLAVVVDVTHATDAPGVDPGELGDHGLGSGPVITRGAIVSRPLNDLLDEAAKAEGIECTTRGRRSATAHRRRRGPLQPRRRAHGRGLDPAALHALAGRAGASWATWRPTISLLTALALRLEADSTLTHAASAAGRES